MALPKPLRNYLIGLALLLLLSLFAGYFGIKQYSFFGFFVNCPYGGEIGPNGEIINARHICPEGGGNTDWLMVSIFSAIVLAIYSIIYWIAYLFVLIFKKLKNNVI